MNTRLSLREGARTSYGKRPITLAEIDWNNALTRGLYGAWLFGAGPPRNLVNRAWDSVREDMRLTNDPQFVPHALRHTCASRLVQRGVGLYTIKEVLGHSTIKVTERYAHLCPANLRSAIDTLEGDGGDPAPSPEISSR